jgi:uncharacterized protein YcaQ
VSPTVSSAEARRIALAAQGFGQPRPKSPIGTPELNSVVDRLAVVQLDSVNVAVRTHYMPFFSRLGPYDQPFVEQMAFGECKQIEYWAHMASLVPTATQPLLRWRMDAATPRRQTQRLMDEDPGYLERVVEEIDEKGPISVGDLDEPGERQGPWWGCNKGKVALEWHFLTGTLTTAYRKNFTRYYDLAERVLPSEVLNAPTPSAEESHRQLLAISAQRLGIATARDLGDYFRIRMPQARPRIAELVEAGVVETVQVDGWDDIAYLWPGAEMPTEIEFRALLSPFDSLIWDRDRVERVFDFLYRIEIYVPERQRKYGYYVMPFLLDEDLVARVDLKSDRQAGVLRVKGAFLEPANPPHDRNRVAAELASELSLMAEWLGLKRVVVGRRGDLCSLLRNSLKA